MAQKRQGGEKRPGQERREGEGEVGHLRGPFPREIRRFSRDVLAPALLREDPKRDGWVRAVQRRRLTPPDPASPGHSP